MTSGSALYKFFEKYQKYERRNAEESDSERKKRTGEMFYALNEILETAPYSVNEVDHYGTTALHRVLWNSVLSTLSIVNLMLSYSAEVNCSDDTGRTPLHVALERKRGKDVIKALLEKGANVTVTTKIGQSALCFALKRGSEDVVQLLLDAGCSTDLCRCHGGSALRCATTVETFIPITTNKEVIQLLIKMKVDSNAVDEHGRSPLCYVLGNGVELWVIDLLVAAGGSLNACTRHASPLHCATAFSYELMRSMSSLRADVFERLLKLVQDNDPVQLLDPTPLQNVLMYRSSEKEVIKMFFDHLQNSGTIIDEYGNTLLHLAVSNRVSQPSIIEFLIESGVEVDLVNDEGETPLQLAVNKMDFQFPSAKDVVILKMLFLAGSRIGNAAVRRFVSHIQYNNRLEYKYCNMLVKCYFLEKPDFRIEHLIQGHPDYAALSAFGANCERELNVMKSTIVREGCTLRGLLDDYSSHRVEEYDFNQLEIIANGGFPVYFDIIATKIIGRFTIEEILREVHVCTPKYISGQKKMVALNYNVVCSIADRLTDDDLLRFILAFRNVNRGMSAARGNNEDAFEGKRGDEQSEQCPKRCKLQV